MAWLRISLRRLGQERVPALGLILLVLVTAFLFAVAPRLLSRVADDALRAEVSGASAAVRDVQLIQERRLGTSRDDPMAPVISAGADLGSEIPPSVSRLFADRIYTVDTPRFRVMSSTRTPSLLSLRVQQGVADHIRYTEGRAPTGALQAVPGGPGTATTPGPTTAFEVALSTESASGMGVKVGDTLQLMLDATDRLNRAKLHKAAVTVVGIFDATDPRDPYWSDDTTLQRPTKLAFSPENILLNAVALMAPEAYPVLLSDTDEIGLPLRYAWRWYVDPTRLEASQVDDLEVGLRRMATVYLATPLGSGPASGTLLRSGLLGFIEGQQERWASVRAILTVVAIGPAAVAAAALGLTVLLGSSRRRSTLGLARSRGASPVQIVGATALEGLVLTVPSALIAGALATVAVPGPVDPPTVLIPLLVAAVTTSLMVAIVVPVARGTSSDRRRDPAEVRRSSPRRLVAELFVIGLAVGGAILLRERSIRGGGSTGQLASADPFIAAVPALAGLAAGLIALRLFAIPIRGLSVLAGFRRDLVPVLGLRRTARSGTAAPILLVLMLTATVGAFSLATLAYLDRAAEVVAWQDVGAPFRLVEGDGHLASDIDTVAASLPGVTAAAGAAQLSLPTAGPGGVELLALDTPGYARVAQGTPLAGDLPAALGSPVAGRLPAIVSPLGVVDGIRPGDPFELRFGVDKVELTAVAVRDAFPTLPPNGPFVVVDRAGLAAKAPDLGLDSTTVFLAASDDAGSGIRNAMRTIAPGVAVEARSERSAAIASAPVVGAASTGVDAGLAAALAYAAIALAAALALTGAARAPETAHLRTLGLTRSESLWLTLVEHGPTVALAVGFGIILGTGTFEALRPGLGLGAIVGSDLDVPVRVGLEQLGLLTAVIILIVGLGVGLGALVEREPSAPAALRRGIQ